MYPFLFRNRMDFLPDGLEEVLWRNAEELVLFFEFFYFIVVTEDFIKAIVERSVRSELMF